MEKTARVSRSFEVVSVVLFLAAIVVANWSVSRWGQAALPFTAAILIPFDMLTRDTLHRRWSDNGPQYLWPRMTALIAAGSVLSFGLSVAAMPIAVASFAAFAAAGASDAAVYQALAGRSALTRMNASNAVSATVDSILFPIIAFDTWSAQIAAAQAGTKFVGGFLFSAGFIFLCRRISKR